MKNLERVGDSPRLLKRARDLWRKPRAQLADGTGNGIHMPLTGRVQPDRLRPTRDGHAYSDSQCTARLRPDRAEQRGRPDTPPQHGLGHERLA